MKSHDYEQGYADGEAEIQLQLRKEIERMKIQNPDVDNEKYNLALEDVINLINDHG